MAKLIYSAIMSLDGYIEDEDGTFDWAKPDAEVHAFINDLERQVGTYLYGRRMKASAGRDITVGGPGLASAACTSTTAREHVVLLGPVVGVGLGVDRFDPRVGRR